MPAPNHLTTLKSPTSARLERLGGGGLRECNAARGAPQAAQVGCRSRLLQLLVVHCGRDLAGQLRERRPLALRCVTRGFLGLKTPNCSLLPPHLTAGGLRPVGVEKVWDLI